MHTSQYDGVGAKMSKSLASCLTQRSSSIMLATLIDFLRRNKCPTLREVIGCSITVYCLNKFSLGKKFSEYQY
jgi:hypothetical protein